MKKIWINVILAFLAGYFIFIPAAFSAETIPKEVLAKQLGWVADPNSPNCCFGYFEDPLIGTQPAPLNKAPVTIKADEGTLLQQGQSVLRGNVEISQPGREISATTAYLNRDKSQADDQTIDLQGHVVVHEPGKLIIGKVGYVDLKTKLIRMQDTYYRLVFGHLPTSTHIYDTVGWGSAGMIERRPDGIVHLEKAAYTTCSPLKPTWMLHASSMDLDQKEGHGSAKHLVLDVKEVPVFYLPYFSFPLDKRRKSGFLFPSFGTSNRQGINLFFPYYWNIAPNYDDTITPAIYSHRNVQITNNFRYLTEHNTGEFYIAFLPNDSTFQAFKQSAPTLYANTPSSASLPDLEKSSNNRFAFSLQHVTNFNEHWSGDIHYSYVNDDYYLQDLTAPPGVIMPNQLLREGQVTYRGSVWNFKGLLQNYLTLHPVNQTPIDNQYSRMPEFDLTADFPSRESELNFQWESQFVNFMQDTAPGSPPPPRGDRLNLQPTLRLPFNEPWGYVTPSVQYQFTQYIINGDVLANGTTYTPNTINRELPILNIDSGLYLDRTSTFRGTTYTQTLEPRVFYLYVPYKNQNNIPEFDAGLPPFGYTQLFLTNRFTGIDRVGDANQISYGVSTRFLNQESSQEIASFGVGQIVYFSNRKVTYCTEGQDCQDINYSPGATPATTIVSPIAGQATFNVSRLWSVNGTLAWDPTLGKTNNGSVGLAYRAPGNRVLNLGYNFLTLGDQVQTNPPTSTDSAVNNLNQAAVSLSWPMYDRWRVFSGVTYNISHVHAQNYLYGLEYDSCCWAMRVVGGRVFQSLNQNNEPVFNNTIFIQWQLKGLGNFGSSDPTNFLTSNIPGYRNNFGQTT